jgi:tripartite-type tricarboxylate transporter receptor subunit TctC
MAISPIGTPNHLGAELLMQLADIKLTIVPYPGVSAAIPDLMTNRIQLALGAIPSVLSYMQDRRLKALAVSRINRSSLVPQIPTADESGLRGYDVNAWTCVMAPRGIPVSVRERLSTTIARVLALPEVQHELAQQGAESAPMSADELGAYIARESSKWATVLQKAQVRE